MNNVVLDATLLTSLMACPRQADNRFNKLLVPAGGKNNSFECGSLVHAILEFYNKALINGKSRAEAILIGYEAGREYIDGYKETNKYILDKEEVGLKNTPEESTKIGKRELIGWKYVFSTMEQYFDFWKNDSYTVIASEQVRGQVIYEDSDLRILWKAKFDEIDDMPHGLISKDHKTMKQRRDNLSLNNQFIGQCVLLKSRNIIINKIGFQSSLKPEEKFERATISYTADKMAEWVNDIVPYYARMLVAYNDAGHFPPNFTSCQTMYGFCDYKEPCESDRGMRDEVLRVNFARGKVWDIQND